jgi:excisionase family DNA binding protein
METKVGAGRLLTVRRTAELLALKESTIRRWILFRRIAVVRVGTRAIRIPASEIERLIEAGSVPARPAKPGVRQ